MKEHVVAALLGGALAFGLAVEWAGRKLVAEQNARERVLPEFDPLAGFRL